MVINEGIVSLHRLELCGVSPREMAGIGTFQVLIKSKGLLSLLMFKCSALVFRVCLLNPKDNLFNSSERKHVQPELGAPMDITMTWEMS